MFRLILLIVIMGEVDRDKRRLNKKKGKIQIMDLGRNHPQNKLINKRNSLLTI